MHIFKIGTGSFIMIKKIAMVFLCTVLGSSLYAENMSTGKGFIGLEVGYATVQGDVGGFFSELDRKGDAVEYGLRVGAQTGEWRTMFTLSYYDSGSDDQNIEKGYLMLDYFFLQNDKSAFRPFIGINAGYVNYESTFIDESGFLYGGQAGFVVNVAESIELDLSYRYSLSNADALDHIDNIVFGINYLY